MNGTGNPEIQNLQLEIKDLHEQIHQVEIEKGHLEDQIEALQRDAAQLIEKDGKVAKERVEERKNLQIVKHLIFVANNRKLKNFKSNCVRHLRKEREWSNNTKKMYNPGIPNLVSSHIASKNVSRTRNNKNQA